MYFARGIEPLFELFLGVGLALAKKRVAKARPV